MYFQDPFDTPLSDSEGEEEEESSEEYYEELTQRGGGEPKQKIVGGPITSIDENEEPYSIIEGESKRISNFGLSSRQFKLSFKDRGNVRAVDEVIRAGISDVLELVKEDMAPAEKVSVRITHPALDKAFGVPFCQPSLLDEDRVITAVNRLLQSAEEMNLDDTFIVTFTIIRPPRRFRKQ